MFAYFFAGIQQDLKLTLIAPLFCALFRLLFILIDAPVKSPRGAWRKWRECFRYGFWWGLDFNAYVFLYSMALVSLPGAFLPAYFAVGDTVRTVGLLVYLAVIYTAFAGKLIFWHHFHDTFNATLKLAGHADKKNFADIFFHEDHGVRILLGYLPVLALGYVLTRALLAIPCVPYVTLGSPVLQYALNTAVFLAAILLFYWLRYGGTLHHRNKPEWDEVPEIVKKDAFFGKAAMDDLVAFELAVRATVSPALRHTDAESAKVLAPILPRALGAGENPLALFRRTAKGAKIKKPSHIFLLFGESHAQAPFDDIYARLGIMAGSKALRAEPHTVAIENFLSGGLVSRPSLVSLLTGVFDANMELNEIKNFWSKSPLTCLPRQLRRLGYRSEFWYGGALNHGSLEHFLPPLGFDAVHAGPDFCPKDAPRTWLGIYDHVFMAQAARRIAADTDETPVLHILYTTSNHGPYGLPYEKYGYDVEKVMPEAPDAVKNDKAAQKCLASAYYADQVLARFVREMREKFPDSLFIITGDHASGVIPFADGIIERREPSFRDVFLTSFAMLHPELTPEMLPNSIGCHENILATLIELIAPAGFAYESVFPPLTEPLAHVVTPYCWLTKDALGDYKSGTAQPLAPSAGPVPTRTEVRFTAEHDALVELSAYLVRHPELLS